MAKGEILIWIAGILMMIILGRAVTPTITKIGNVAKIAVIDSEIENIIKGANLWIAQNPLDFNLNYYCNFNTSVAKDFVNLKYNSSNGTLISKANNAIEYSTMCNGNKLKINIVNLYLIDGAINRFGYLEKKRCYYSRPNSSGYYK